MQADAEARVIDAAVDVALLCGLGGALEPGLCRREPALARQAVTHLVQAAAEAFVIDAAVDVALLFRLDGALEPGLCRRELALKRQAVTHKVQAAAEARMIDAAVDVALLFGLDGCKILGWVARHRLQVEYRAWFSGKGGSGTDICHGEGACRSVTP